MSKRLFVVIAAVSEYLNSDVPQLPGVRRDAERLRSTLEEHAVVGVHRMWWLVDGRATKATVLSSLQEVSEQAGATDQAIIYFGGHGWRVLDGARKRGTYYLLPYDATFASVATDGISTDEIGALLNSQHAQEIVVILDCCHSGGMTNFSWTNEVLEGLLEGWRSHYVIAASRGREQAGEDDGGGFFMTALCDALVGEGVTPDEKGRFSVQKAWSHAADVANSRSVQGGHNQVAVSAGISSPIYLTRREASPVAKQRDNTQEFVEVLNSRAYLVIAYIDDQRHAALSKVSGSPAYAEKEIRRQFDEIEERFRRLHEQYLTAIKQNKVQLSHELLNHIHRLLYDASRAADTSGPPMYLA